MGDVLDPRIAYDQLREHGLSRDGTGPWLVCRHQDALAVVTRPEMFSSAVSRFLQVPNGLDGEAHAAARRLLDPFFAPDRMAALAPAVHQIAREAVAPLLDAGPFDAVGDLGARFAVRAQSAWLGWPASIEDELLAWMQDNHAASRSGELARTAEVAHRFDAIIHRLISARREAGENASDDVTTELIRLRDGEGSPLPDEVLVSVLRNWTGGDLGSIALCVGVLVHRLATSPALRDGFRAAADDVLDAAIDEVLRIDDPFVSNRRIASVDTQIDGCPIRAGDRLTVNWTAANRDPRAFGDPEAFDPVGHAAANLVYGTGRHVCPGRPLATLELRILARELVGAGRLRLHPGGVVERELPPVGGYRRLDVVLTGR